MMGKGLPVVIVKLRSQASAASHVIVGWIEHRTGVVTASLISFGAVVVPTIVILLLYALPCLDRQPGHDAIRRPFVTAVGILVVVVVVLNMLLAVSRIVNFPSGS